MSILNIIASGQVLASGQTVIVLTSGSTWSVPADWNDAENTIECVGGGQGGADGDDGSKGGHGGFGGDYSIATNVNLPTSGTIDILIGAGGAHGGGGQTRPAAGGDTWVKDAVAGSLVCLAPGGESVTSAVGTNTAGGIGGDEVNSTSGQGAGGAAGPNGIGGEGGSDGSFLNSSGGGGGANGGDAGEDGGEAPGGQGGNNRFGAGGGLGAISPTQLALDGTNGGGGGGGDHAFDEYTLGADGSMEANVWTETDSPFANFGPGGGGGGGAEFGTDPGEHNGGDGGLYGGAGGGGGYLTNTTTYGIGGEGADGIIVISYTPI